MIKAIKDRVFIRLDTKPVETKGGILLPETEEKPQTIGIIEDVGPEVASVKKGDKVLFHIFDELPSYDKEVVVVRENSILGVFEDE